MASSGEVLTCLREIVGELHAGATQARECHWNVTGMSFGPLHALFGEVYDQLSDMEDTVAERVRALKGKMPVTCINAVFPLATLAGAKAKGMLEGMLQCHLSLYACMCKAIKEYEAVDPVTTNMLQDLAAKIDKHAWMLRAHLME